MICWLAHLDSNQGPKELRVGESRCFARSRPKGAAHWHGVGLRLLRVHQAAPAAAEETIAAWIEDPAELAL